MELIPRACPICGSTDESSVFAAADFDFARLDTFAFASRKLPEYMHYRLLSCPTCDLLYASPVPRAEDLAGSYSDADFDSAVEARYAAMTYGSYLPEIKRRLPDLQGTLDIGTGDGAFLEQLLDQGFTGVAGIEPSKAPIAAASSKVKHLIREEIFQGDNFPAESMSLINCFQTLEHLPDPLAMGKSAYAMLKKGGAVFFVCHNRRAASARILGLKSPIFDIEHLQLFSPKSARSLLERCGFTDIAVHPIINRYPLHYWLKLFPLPNQVKTYLLALLQNYPLGRLPIPFPVGNLAIIGYKPQ